jgi:hypothetical protein
MNREGFLQIHEWTWCTVDRFLERHRIVVVVLTVLVVLFFTGGFIPP